MKDIGSRRRDAVSAATEIAGGVPGEMTRSRQDIYMKIVWTGIILENAPDLSLAGMAAHAGLDDKHHSSVFEWVGKWRLLPWRVRHGWLMMAESVGSQDVWKGPYELSRELNRMCEESRADHGGFRHVAR